MIKLGLTGNIGSGKSTVARIFEILGVPIYHADDEAKKLLQLPDVAEELLRIFGQEVFAGQNVDRKKLAAIVFHDKWSLNKLNSIIHPRVRQDFDQWIENQQGHAYIIQEAAILFESGFYKFFDRNIVVTCPAEMAIHRVMKRDQVPESVVRSRLQNQWAESKKVSLSHYVIDNSGSQLIIPQVLKIHEDISY